MIYTKPSSILENLAIHLLLSNSSKAMPSTNTADSVPAEQANASATWLNRATTADENDQRAQPWKAHVKDTLPINVSTKEAEYIVLTLENNVQHNGKNP